MKTLYIGRHAKSSWDYPELPDIDRPVTEKGINNTKKVLREMQNKGICIDLLISSYAKRAYETAKIIAAGINYPVEKIDINKNIYRCDENYIFDLLYEISDNIDTIMIIGHNPTLTQFINYFIDKKFDILPTSGIVSMSFDINKWNKIAKAKPKINFILFPKLISSGNIS